MKRALLKYRLKSLKHLAGQPRGLELGLSALVLVGVLFAAGMSARESLLQQSSATWAPQMGQRVALPGLRALEAAFWATAVLAAVQCFRVMELLFRREDVTSLALLPVSAHALFVERALTANLEALLIGLVGSAFFLPLALETPLVCALCCVLLLAGLTAATCITMGVVMWFGNEYGHPDSRVGGDAYGGTGGAFIYAPGAALTATLIALVLAQFTLAEVLKAGHITRAFWVGLALFASLAGIGLLMGWRSFGRYHLVAAWFREVDTVGFASDVTYQTTSWAPVWVERLVPSAKLTLRRTWIQSTRYDVVVENLQNLLHAAVAVASWWMLQEGPELFWAAPIIITCVFSPWSRMRAAVLGRANSSVLPLTFRDDFIADVVYIGVRLGRRAGVYAVVIFGISVAQGQTDVLLLGSAFGPLALHGAWTTWTVFRGRAPSIVLIIVWAIMLISCAYFSLLWASLACLCAALGIAFARIAPRSPVTLELQ